MYVVVDYDDGAARPVSMWKCLSADGVRVWKCNGLLQFLQALYDNRMAPKMLGQETPEYVALGVIKSESSDVSANYREGIIWVGGPSRTGRRTTWARMFRK